MTGNTIDMYDPETANSGLYPYASISSNTPSIKGRILYIPLPVWFSKEIGKALPICALLYHTVEILIDIP